MTFKDITFKDVPFKLFLIFVAICPIFFDPSYTAVNRSLRLNQEQFFQIGCTLLFPIIFVENIYLVLFLCYAVFLYCFYNFPPIAGSYLVNISWGCLLYQTAYKLIDEKNIKTFFKVMIGVCVLNIIWLILQATDSDLIFKSDTIGGYSKDLVGMMGIKCFMGMLFALCIPFLGRFSKWAAGIFLIPCAFSLSSVAVVGGIAAFLWNFWWESKKWFFAFLAVLTVVGSVYVYQDTKMRMFDTRYSVWKVSMRDAFKHPLIGWGMNSFSNIGDFKPFMYMMNNRTKETKAVPASTIRAWTETGNMPSMKDFVKEGDSLNPWEHPHSEFISLFFEFGIIGILLAACLAWNIYTNFIPTKDMIALMGFFIALMVCSTGQYPFHVARIAYLIPIVLGAYYKLVHLNKIEELSYGTT